MVSEQICREVYIAYGPFQNWLFVGELCISVDITEDRIHLQGILIIPLDYTNQINDNYLINVLSGREFFECWAS